MSGNILDVLSHPAAADPDFYNKGLQNLNALRDTQAKQAIADITQQSVDPQGRVDPAKLNLLISQNPRAAWAGLSALKSTQELQGQQITQQGQTLEQNLAKAKWANAAAGSLTRLGPNITQQDAISALHDGLTQGILTPAEYQRQVAQLPSDAAGLNAWANQHQFTAMSVQQQLEQGFGTTGTEIDPSGRRIGTVQSPASQGGRIGAAPQAGVPLGIDPGQVAARQQWLQTARDYPDPADKNVTKHGTNETYLRDTGVPERFIYPGGAPAQYGTQPATASPLGTGRPPAALLNPNKPQATPSPAPAPVATPSPAGTGISGPTPEQSATAAATKAQGELSPPRFQAEADAGTQAQSQQATLGNMLADTAQFTTGPLAGIVGKVRNLAGNLGLNINTEAQSAKESFNKLAAGLANAQGAGSDQRMAVNIDANPHVELSPAGVDLVTRQLQGNADYLQARAKLAQQHPNKADYPGFQQTVAGLDPRVFQLSRMTGDQRTTYWNALDSTAKTQLGAAIKKAKDMGVLGDG